MRSVAVAVVLLTVAHSMILPCMKRRVHGNLGTRADALQTLKAALTNADWATATNVLARDPANEALCDDVVAAARALRVPSAMFGPIFALVYKSGTIDQLRLVASAFVNVQKMHRPEISCAVHSTAPFGAAALPAAAKDQVAKVCFVLRMLRCDKNAVSLAMAVPGDLAADGLYTRVLEECPPEKYFRNELAASAVRTRNTGALAAVAAASRDLSANERVHLWDVTRASAPVALWGVPQATLEAGDGGDEGVRMLTRQAMAFYAYGGEMRGLPESGTRTPDTPTAPWH